MILQAAENRLMVDYHGIYKPTGLQRTYPNVMVMRCESWRILNGQMKTSRFTQPPFLLCA
jgi:hypothetical protein